MSFTILGGKNAKDLFWTLEKERKKQHEAQQIFLGVQF